MSKLIKIQTNSLYAESRPTTQDDNFGGIADKWDVYHDEECYYQKVGNLVKYLNGTYALFVNRVRIALQSDEVII